MGTTVTRGGMPTTVEGHFPQRGETAPVFSLVDKELKDITLDSFPGKRKILNIFPSIDTPTCAMSVRSSMQRLMDYLIRSFCAFPLTCLSLKLASVARKVLRM
jgi:peroxiredoxin